MIFISNMKYEKSEWLLQKQIIFAGQFHKSDQKLF